MEKKSLDFELRELTLEALKLGRARWKNRSSIRPRDNGSFIWFMGTGGNPEATICQQPATAGFVVGIAKLLIYVDPGPGAAVKAAEAGFDPGLLDGIFISHGHVDHYAGVEPIIEGMCWAMSQQRGVLLAPAKVFEEGLVSRFHQGFGDKKFYKGGPRVIVLKPFEKVPLNEVVSLTPIPVHHGQENYGFTIEAPGIKIGYTSDTNYVTSFITDEGLQEGGRWGAVMDILEIEGYRKDLKDIFSGVDILIANITSHNALLHRHITGLGLAHLLRGTQVKLCIITHFGHACVHPVDMRDKMAQFVMESSGVKTIAAKELAKIKLDKFLC